MCITRNASDMLDNYGDGVVIPVVMHFYGIRRTYELFYAVKQVLCAVRLQGQPPGQLAAPHGSVLTLCLPTHGAGSA